MRNCVLEDEVKELIEMKRADDYWCFRRKHYTNDAQLLHAILCMANNRVGRDAYIIFGVDEKEYEIVGVEDDIEGRDYLHIRKVLEKADFSEKMIPRVDLKTLILKGHQVDILIVMNSFDTPYYLTKDFRHAEYQILAHHIYTRVAGQNTNMSESADRHLIELLWKKRIHYYESRYF